MTRTHTVDYHVTNALGTTLATFDSLDLAKGWVRRHAERFPSIRVERVTITVERELMFRPRLATQSKQEIAA